MKKAAAFILIFLFLFGLCACTDKGEIQSVSVADGSIKETFDVDEEFCYGDALIEVKYSKGKSETIAVTSDMVKNFDTTRTGRYTMTISYGGKEIPVEYEVIFSAFPSREIVTDARLTLSQREYPTGIGRAVSVSAGTLEKINAVTFTLKGSVNICNSSLTTVAVQTHWTVKTFYLNQKTVKFLFYKEGGSTGGDIAVINFAGAQNAEISLSDAEVSDGRNDYYLPDVKGV